MEAVFLKLDNNKFACHRFPKIYRPHTHKQTNIRTRKHTHTTLHNPYKPHTRRPGARVPNGSRPRPLIRRRRRRRARGPISGCSGGVTRHDGAATDASGPGGGAGGTRGIPSAFVGLGFPSGFLVLSIFSFPSCWVYFLACFFFPSLLFFISFFVGVSRVSGYSPLHFPLPSSLHYRFLCFFSFSSFSRLRTLPFYFSLLFCSPFLVFCVVFSSSFIRFPSFQGIFLPTFFSHFIFSFSVLSRLRIVFPF